MPLNFEMAATEEMVAIALDIAPHACCLVPERREERTTEGGLDVIAGGAALAHKVEVLGKAGIRVSLFVAPDPEQIAASAAIGAAVVELHTGTWCEALAAGHGTEADAELGPAARRGDPGGLARAGGSCRARARLRQRRDYFGLQ